MQYKEFFLIDMVKTSYERYYAPILPVVDCLSPKSECSRDKSVIHKAVLEKNGMAAGNDSIFRIGNILDKVIIVRLDVAESILRRKPYGIRLTHVRAFKSKFMIGVQR